MLVGKKKPNFQTLIHFTLGLQTLSANTDIISRKKKTMPKLRKVSTFFTKESDILIISISAADKPLIHFLLFAEI